MMWFGFGTHETPNVVAECQAAEQAGFDGVLFPEHHGIEGWVPNPLLLCYKVGQATSVIAIGTAPILLPLYEPVRLAETAAFIQNELGGRLLLGVGGGYTGEDFAHFGVDLKQRGSRQEEAIQILRLAWTGEPFRFDGRRYSVSAQRCLPVPDVAPPIWVCAGAAPGVARAARLGDALVLDGMRPVGELRALVESYRRDAAAQGRRGEVILTKRLWVGNPADARRLMSEAVSRYADTVVAGSHAPWLGNDSQVEPAGTYWGRTVIAGSSEVVAEQLLAWADDLKPDGVIIKLPYITHSPDHETALRQLDAIGGVLRSIRAQAV
jgi:alkanesulfonate monooxygenase SsuD/methylene tetrahydromethanopterin reductase-like flavin-dependent oxidoreductase (luciferase family)